MAISRQTVLRQRKETLSAQLGKEIVLMSCNFDNYYGLDAIGADIWVRLKEPIAVGALCSGLAADYNADASVIEQDVLDLLQELLQNELIETAS